ncbi:hypothetical protein CHLNCDRAFT_134595 [Chlorella variabilis]|uniref:starch synthase n=1 Tax=Chlorella variabilis TaxID=554065 RepID=E1ZGA0_CHLVA|nr:hypothetical protein CHLNCDRAFT_134595 [Chlorella variabilis]EFN55259.1 hypothetical protein CHLNCDRAFT_134595 [Chlorella variabilis]|eukprot:XP_005847361.1 hypothetical protein CHLNCDRAFT_134595 [Chlorella variabilis]
MQLASSRLGSGLDATPASRLAGGSLGSSRPLQRHSRLHRGAGGRRQVVATAASDDAAEQLRQENERLRQARSPAAAPGAVSTLEQTAVPVPPLAAALGGDPACLVPALQAMAARLNALSPEKRTALIEQHNRLRDAAKATGAERIKARAAAATKVAEPEAAAPSSSKWGEESVRRGMGEKAAATGMQRNGASSSPAAAEKPAPAASKPAAGSPATLSFGGGGSSSGGASAAAATTVVAPPPSSVQPPKPAAAAPAPAAAAPPAPAAAAPAPAAAAAQPAVTPAFPKGPAAAAKPPPPPPPPRDFSKDIAAANKEVDTHDPKVLAQGRESWLYFTVPEKPVAGAQCVVYFNRSQSEPLMHQGRLQMHPKYNTWEVAAPEGDRVDMPHEGRINRGEGVDYYSARVTIPDNAFEMNFVFSNGDGVFDNNSSQNYLVPVTGPMTRDMWIDTAPERAEAAWKLQKEEEERKAAEAAAAALAAKEEADQRKAEDVVGELKREYAAWQKGAAKQELGRWRMLPAMAQPGSVVKLQYNRLGGPLASFDVPQDQNLTLKIGHNNWKAPQDVKMVRSAAPGPAATAATSLAATITGVDLAEEWWEALYSIPDDAAALNFVVTYFEHYDNNEKRDFKVLVDLPSKHTVESWADSMLRDVKNAITRKRLEEEAAAAVVEAERKAKRRAAQAKAEAVRRKQQKHVLFTVPEVPQAGQDVTVYYNPNNGGLPGRQHIWIKGGWNRWRHPKAFGPLEMDPPKEGDHHSVTVTVPKDAYYLDFVFTDAPEHGEYDSNYGLDFHVRVQGSVLMEPPLHVVHIAVEMAPICKVGGLGDVVTSLGRAVQDQGHQVEVILPRYDFFQQSPLLGGTQYETEFDWGGTKIFVSTCIVEGLRCFFIEPRNGMFSGPVYAGQNDGQRFDFFSKAALEFLLRSGRQPDILHCHDWSSAEVARAYWQDYHQFGLWKPNVVLTIHNMDFGQIKLGEAAYYSQRFTTVSPSYAWEIGGHPAIAPNVSKLRGVRNGIDIDIWDPETDQYLPRGFTADTVVEGKKAAREELRKRVNLSGWGDKPMVGVVSRLTKQKGTHLIAHACHRTIDRGGQFVLLGSAPDPKVQAEFQALKDSFGGQDAAFCFAFDEPLSHLIYAACDIIVVPSMFEPCGLTQMIAMRYGAVPVVRQTGGLRDTVFDVDNDKPRAAWEMEGSTDWQADRVDATNGFSFEGTDPDALDYALNRAMDAYYNDRQWFHGLQKRVMEQDWSWNKPAHDYIELYYAALK